MKEFNSEIDQLFRNKLADRKVTPSAEAWEKLHIGLNQAKRKKPAVYWYVAASVILLISFGILFYSLNDPSSTHQLAVDEAVNQEKDTKANLTEPVLESDIPAVDQTDTQTLEIQKNDVPQVQSDQPDRVAKAESENIQKPENILEEEENQVTANQLKETEQQEIASNEIDRSDELKIDDQLANNKIETDNSKLGREETLTVSAQQEQGEFFSEVKIVYKKSDTQAEKKKTFKKIINVARDITEGEYGIGDLREAKNELLAFGKRKDKEEQ